MYTDELRIPQIRTRSDAELWAAQNSVRLTKTDLKRINELEVLAVEQKQNTISPTSWVEWFVRYYLKLLETIEGASDVLFTLLRAIIVSFGVPVVLVLLLFVEQQRVAHGISLFETNHQLASFGAWALVLLNLVLEFTIEYVEHREGFKQREDVRFSLRVWLEDLAYIIGVGNQWRAQTKSPASRNKDLSFIVTATILILALAGSMSDIITTIDGTWYEGLKNVMLNSSLHLMVTWIGGLLFATAAVLSAQGLSRYVAQRCIDIISNLESIPSTDDGLKATRDGIAIQYILGKVNEVVTKRAPQDSIQNKSGLKNGTKHYKDTDWTPKSEQYLCACGCSETVEWSGVGRKTLYVNDAHRMQHKRATKT